VDITVEVMLPVRGATDFTGKGNNYYPMLGVVEIYNHMKVTDVVGMPRTGYIHVLNVPELRFPLLKRVLRRKGLNGKKRSWAGLDSRLTALQKNRLLTNRQITMGWLAFRSLLRNLDEDRDLVEADVSSA
jgi:hypothetical protein